MEARPDIPEIGTTYEVLLRQDGGDYGCIVLAPNL